jgi:hypothetical protein
MDIARECWQYAQTITVVQLALARARTDGERPDGEQRTVQYPAPVASTSECIVMAVPSAFKALLINLRMADVCSWALIAATDAAPEDWISEFLLHTWCRSQKDYLHLLRELSEKSCEADEFMRSQRRDEGFKTLLREARAREVLVYPPMPEVVDD